MKHEIDINDVKVYDIIEVERVMKNGISRFKTYITWIDEREQGRYMGHQPLDSNQGLWGCMMLVHEFKHQYGIQLISVVDHKEPRLARDMPCLKGNPSYDLMM
jgi:hypothetical protein